MIGWAHASVPRKPREALAEAAAARRHLLTHRGGPDILVGLVVDEIGLIPAPVPGIRFEGAGALSGLRFADDQ
jgi:hypothetical protein